MTKNPLYEIIFKDYEKKILSGKLQPGDKLPTEKEISSIYHVSRITATRGLNELAFRKLIRRIKGSGSYVNAVEVTEKEPPRLEDHMSIISLVLPLEGRFSAEILQGIEDVAKEQNYFVTFHNSEGNPVIEKEIIEEIMYRGSRGIILYPSSPSENLDLYSGLLIDHYPIVLIDRKIPGVEMPLVWADNQKGFYDITKYLLDLGHRRIAFISTSVFDISSEMERYYGYCKAHVDHAVPLMAKHLFSEKDMRNLPPDYKPELPLFQREAHKLFDLFDSMNQNERPTALATVHDVVARELITAAVERGLKIPGDYSITGFDDIPSAAHLVVPLTTIAQPIREIGRVAAKELFYAINQPGNQPRTVTIEGKLIKRRSTDIYNENE